MDSEKNLSSEYWNLHRNSLFLSAALFMVCLIPNVGDITLLGLKIEGVGAAALAVLLMVAATYAYIIFFMEWAEEALVTYRQRRENFVANQKGLKNINERMSKIVDQIEQSATTTDYVLKALSQGEVPFPRQELDKVFKQAEAAVKVDLQNDLQLTSDPSSGTCSHDMNYISDHLDRFTSHFQKYINENIRTQEQHYDQSLMSSLDQVKKEQMEAAKQLGLAEDYVAKLDARVSLSIKKDWLRYIMFGIVVPTAAFGASIYHGIDKVGLVKLDSPIVKHLRTIDCDAEYTDRAYEKRSEKWLTKCLEKKSPT